MSSDWACQRNIFSSFAALKRSVATVCYYIPHIFRPFQYVEQEERANSEVQALLDIRDKLVSSLLSQKPMTQGEQPSIQFQNSTWRKSFIIIEGIMIIPGLSAPQLSKRGESFA
jgi:hypothetical protein